MNAAFWIVPIIGASIGFVPRMFVIALHLIRWLGDPPCHRFRRVDHRLAGSAAAAMQVRRVDQCRLKRIFAILIPLVGQFAAARATGLIPTGIK
jgi:hypothetical protein